jgi:hypothetical protein
MINVNVLGDFEKFLKILGIKMNQKEVFEKLPLKFSQWLTTLDKKKQTHYKELIEIYIRAECLDFYIETIIPQIRLSLQTENKNNSLKEKDDFEKLPESFINWFNTLDYFNKNTIQRNLKSLGYNTYIKTIDNIEDYKKFLKNI